MTDFKIAQKRNHPSVQCVQLADYSGKKEIEVKAEVATVKAMLLLWINYRAQWGYLLDEECQTDLYVEDPVLDTVWQTHASSHTHGSTVLIRWLRFFVQSM